MSAIRRLLMAAGIAAVMTTPVLAADLPVPLKAVPYTAANCTFTTGCNNFYLGGGISEAGGSFNVISTGVGGLADNNLNIFGEAGYDYWNPSSSNIYLGANALFEYGVIQNGALPGGGNSELWGGGAWAKIGYNVAGAMGLSVPTATNPITSLFASTVPYVDLGIFCRPWGCGFASGAGAMGWLSKNVTMHFDYLHVNYNNASINPVVSEQSEDMAIAGLDYHFGL